MGVTTRGADGMGVGPGAGMGSDAGVGAGIGADVGMGAGNDDGMDAGVKGQLTLRGVVIGIIGCAVITASSIYVALRMGALLWPIVFAAILSLFVLKAVSRGRSTLNEANVTHTVMSSGAMVAGGLAFTIPGAWMSGLADEMSMLQQIGRAHV